MRAVFKGVQPRPLATEDPAGVSFHYRNGWITNFLSTSGFTRFSYVYKICVQAYILKYFYNFLQSFPFPITYIL